MIINLTTEGPRGLIIELPMSLSSIRIVVVTVPPRAKAATFIFRGGY